MYCKGPLDTMKRSCTKDHHKWHRTHPALQEHFRASGDRLLDAHRKQKRLDLICKNLTEKSLKKICFSSTQEIRKSMTAQRTCTENKEALTHRARSHRRNDTKRDVQKDTMEKESLSEHVESFCRQVNTGETYNSASCDSLERFAVAIWRKRSNKTP